MCAVLMMSYKLNHEDEDNEDNREDNDNEDNYHHTSEECNTGHLGGTSFKHSEAFMQPLAD